MNKKHRMHLVFKLDNAKVYDITGKEVNTELFKVFENRP